MIKDERPLSPHLTIYRWPITMTLSILHRITGVALAVGLVALVFWLEAIAYEAVSYDLFNEVASSIIGQIALLGWLFSFFFHLANGIRHLVWDSGSMFEKRQVDLSAWAVLIAAVVMTACYWVIV